MIEIDGRKLTGIKYDDEETKKLANAFKNVYALAKKYNIKIDEYYKDEESKIGLGMTHNGLQYYDLELDQKIRIIKQNSKKYSTWAQLARAKHSVWQVVDPESHKYYGVIIDKKLYRYTK